MHLLRRILLALVAVAALGGAVAWQLWYQLPPPEQASRQQLLRWLVLRDLREEPLEVRHALMERLDEELRQDIPLPVSTSELSDARRVRLKTNARLLTQLWFVTRVNQYHDLPSSARVDFLEQQLDTILTWSSINAQLAPESDGDPAQSSAAATLFDQIETWMQQATGPLRQRMKGAVHDGLVVWLATADLSELKPAARRTVALRLAEAIQGDGASDIALPLTTEQREQLVANARLLVQAWFYEQAARYYQLPDEQRWAFIDQRIDQFLRTGVLDLLAGPQVSTDGWSTAVSRMQLMGMIDSWIEGAEPGERQRLRDFAQAVQQRLLWRQVQQMWRSNQP